MPGHDQALLPRASEQEEKEASESGSRGGQQRACPPRVWLSLKENKSGATWTATRTGDDDTDGLGPLSVPRQLCGKGEMSEHNPITHKQEQRERDDIHFTADSGGVRAR